MWRLILVYCSIIAALHDFKVRRPIKKCIANKGPLPLGAEVQGCTNSAPPCTVTEGEITFIPIAFAVPRFTTTLFTRVITYQTTQRVVIGMQHDMFERRHTCRYLLDATCPVRQGEILLYPLEILVHEPNFESGEAGAYEISIMDDRQEEVVCLRVEFVITMPSQQYFDERKYYRRKNHLIQLLYDRV